MKKTTVLILLSFFSCSYGWFFDRDTAVYNAQNGDWKKTGAALQKLVTDNVDKPDVLYDAGVAAYKNKEYKQAQAYFNNVTKQSTASNILKEQAYFNSGNTHVMQKELQKAIDVYEKALEINPDNEKAKHNLEKVKQMLQQQQQQDQQNNQDQKDQEQKKDQDKQQDNNQDQQENQDQNDDQQQDDQKKNDEEQQSDNNQQEQDQQHNNNNEQQSENNEQQENDSQSQQDEQSEAEQEQQQDQEGDVEDHEQQEEQELQQQEQPAEPTGREKLDEWLAQILQKQQEEDARLNKKLIKVNVSKELKGQHGQNNW